MPIGHLKDAIGEAGSLAAYGICSIVGAWVDPGHYPRGYRRPVVLVPGFLGRGLAFFRLKRTLAARGHGVYVADLGYGVGCIEQKARLLEEFIADCELEDFYIVGHSMGGIISMTMDDRFRRRVRHFITLGTTFRGAILSYLFPMFPAARQLNPDSELLERVAKRARDHDNLTSIIARWDEIALPEASCHVEGCVQRTEIPGHAQLIMRSSSCAEVCGLLEELESR